MHAGMQMNQMRMMQLTGGDPTGGSRLLACLVKYQCFKKNYLRWLQFKMCINGYLNQYLMTTVLMSENALDRQWLAKEFFFPFRGFYPIYLISNLAMIWVLYGYGWYSTPHIIWTICNLTILLKIVYTFALLVTDPGKVKRDNKIERYIKNNRKDLANVKAPMGLGTPPIRANFDYNTKSLYAKYETFSYIFMQPIAAKNAGFYYLFFLNELFFCFLYALCLAFNIGELWETSVIKLTIVSIIYVFYIYRMYFDHKRIYLSMRSNITVSERITCHKNPVFLNPDNTFYNPFDKGFCGNIIEFFVPCWACCCLPSAEKAEFGKTVRVEFPEGIKNSVLSQPKSQKRKENRNTEASYEQIARDSTIEATHDDDEVSQADEENKIGDSETDRSQDLRYDIDAIIENSICPKFDKSKYYNWGTARFYSVIDIIGHPMHKQAKMVLTRHLERLQHIEKQQESHGHHHHHNESEESVEGEESESDEEEQVFSSQIRPRDGATNAQIPHIRGPMAGQMPHHMNPHMAGQNPVPMAGPMMGAGHGPFGHGNQLPNKEQVLQQFNQMMEMRTKQMAEAEKRLSTAEDKERFKLEKERFLQHMEIQKQQMLQRIEVMAQKEDEDAFKIDDDEEEEEESEEESKEDITEVTENIQKVESQVKSLQPPTSPNKEQNLLEINEDDQPEDQKEPELPQPKKEETQIEKEEENEEEEGEEDQHSEAENEAENIQEGENISQEAEGEKEDEGEGEGEGKEGEEVDVDKT